MYRFLLHLMEGLKAHGSLIPEQNVLSSMIIFERYTCNCCKSVLVFVKITKNE